VLCAVLCWYFGRWCLRDRREVIDLTASAADSEHLCFAACSLDSSRAESNKNSPVKDRLVKGANPVNGSQLAASYRQCRYLAVKYD